MTDHVDNRNRIFISYRRDDSAGESGRIYDRLVQEFGADSVFKDIDSIPLGINFKNHIDSIIRKCDVVLVIIGQQWAGTEAGKSRLDNPRDLVRLEVEAALQRDIPVIPVFVNDASIESEETLPSSMVELLDRNGIAVGHDPHFHPDMNRLIKDLKHLFEPLHRTKKDAAEPEVKTVEETKKVDSSRVPRDFEIPLNPPRYLPRIVVNNPATSIILAFLLLGIVSAGSFGSDTGIAEKGIILAAIGISAGIILALFRVFRGKR